MTVPAAGTVIRGGSVLTGDGFVDADVVVADGLVDAVIAGPAAASGDWTGDGHGDGVIDASDLLVVAGFVDLQINGAHGIDLQSEPERLWEVGALLLRDGVTAFLPTIVTGPVEIRERALAALAAGPPDGDDWCGAVPLGIHFEGPMLSPARAGAHDRRFLVEPSLDVVAGWSRERGVALVTLAPEMPGATEVIRSLRERGVVVSVGHTDATAAGVAAAVEAGATYVTHLFNAMSPLAHRAPGAVGAALAHPDVVAGLIVDGIHVDPVAVAAAWRALGPERTNLVTDAVAAMGLAPGEVRLGAATLTNGADGVRLADGTLAGSNLSLDAAVRNLVDFTGCPIVDALATVTRTPARVLGDRSRGRIAPGARADLALLTTDLRVVATVVGGVVRTAS